MLSALTLPAGRRAKFLFVAFWIALLAAAGPLAGKFEDAQENDPVSFLPGEAESVKALQAADDFPSGEVVEAVTVFRREGGLTAADRRVLAVLKRDLNENRPEAARPTAGPVLSRDRTTALLLTPIVPDYSSDVLLDSTKDIRERVEQRAPPGVEAKVSGPAGYTTDAVDVFNQINGTLLLATASLVLVLLILIYRSPIFWVIPFFAVLVAEVASRAAGYGIAEAGVTVNGQSGGILPVLVFGAGTDYALLLVARYREELRRHEDKHEAMALALRRAGPAIIASGATVVAALLTLSLAELNGTQGLGPIGAMGIAIAMVSMLTLLPALLVLAGRRAFWPFIPHFGDSGADETHGRWRALGERIGRAPRRVWIGAAAMLAVCALGLLQLNSDLTSGNAFREDVDSVQGQELIESAFPAGANAPTNVIVPDTERAAAVRRALQRTRGVASVSRPEVGSPGAKLLVTLEAEPYSKEAYRLIPTLRSVADRAAGADTLIGGPTAEEKDVRDSAVRDNRLIVPVALVVVFAILALLLRALVAPAILIGTVIASFAAALGLGAFFFENVFGFAGMDPSLPLYAFVFLVALGVDYNIFLMARVREETLAHGTRQGMVRGLAVTGAVITSAGIVLAGTFSTLAVLPLVSLTEIGFVIAAGVLLDTFLVRSVLVPALVLDMGDRTWWPSSLGRRRPAATETDGRPSANGGGVAPEMIRR